MSADVTFPRHLLAVPIETVGGGGVERFMSLPGWQHGMRHLSWARPPTRRAGPISRFAMRFAARAPDDAGPQEGPIDYREFVEERHHHSYGTPWIEGRLDFDLLRVLGMRPQDAVLDFGCGAGRVGIWLIPYLEPGRYCGVDPHLRSLAAFSAYEIPLHGLAGRKPRLLHDDRFSFGHFAMEFDLIIDFSTSRWLPAEGAIAAYAAARQVLSPAGRLIVARNIGPSSAATAAPWPILDETVRAVGLRVQDRGAMPVVAFGDGLRRAEWVALVAA